MAIHVVQIANWIKQNFVDMFQIANKQLSALTGYL